MRGIHLVPAGTKLSFIPKKTIFFGLSVLIFLGSIGLFLSKGLNYGIDFQGGIMMEIRTEQAMDVSSMRRNLNALGLGEVALQEFGSPTDVLIRIQKQKGDESAQQVAVETVKIALGEGVEYRRTEFVGPKISDELFWDGVMAVGLALVAILIYIWFRFEWQFGVGAVVALGHDVVATIGVFALLGLEFNLSTVAAVLTIAGYSINDTVVVFDRIREYVGLQTKRERKDIINSALNSTLSRTFSTSLSTFFVVLAIFVFGGDVIRGFTFALLIGVVVGTYSSLFIATPVVYDTVTGDETTRILKGAVRK